MSGDLSILYQVLISAYTRRKVDLLRLLVKLRRKLCDYVNYVSVMGSSQNRVNFRKLLEDIVRISL